jgi:predicted porin
MKKSLLVLAVLGAFAGVASAQSSVTIYGTFDAGVRNLTNAAVDAKGNGLDKLSMGSNGTYNSNRIGFRGVEDLGGGMNAHFTLENGFNSGTGGFDNAGNVLFNRTAAVGVGGAWGSVDLGRQYTVAFKTVAAYEPFTYKYVAITPAVLSTAGIRYNNDIQYAGTFGPVTVRAEYAVGEQPGSTSASSATAVGASYANGPLNVGFAYTERNVCVTAVPTCTATFDNKHYTVGGAFQVMPALKVSVGYADEKQATATIKTETEYSWIGASYAFTPALTATYAFYRTEVSGATAVTAKKDLNIIGATYALSKRTNLYAALDMVKLEGAARVGGVQTEQTGVSLGVNHAF